MKWAERIVMVSLVFVLAGGVAWGYFAVKHERTQMREAVARGEYEVPDATESAQTATDDWRSIYPDTVPLTVGPVVVEASVADTMTKRIKGLSKTPFLPEGVVKLFAFGVPGEHSIWMKDMNYALDILWVAKEGDIVHIEENISPDTHPESFSSSKPAWYVIEANAGFVERHKIELGDKAQLPGQ